MNSMSHPCIIKGGVAVDDRGRVTFCNDFDMSDVKRFYMLENHQEGYIRAWHGHLREAKWVTVVSGVAVVGVAIMYSIDDAPLKIGNAGKCERFTLHPNGDVLYIPPGYANGHMNLVQGTRLIHFSNLLHEDTVGDDVRFDSSIHGWVWEVKPR